MKTKLLAVLLLGVFFIAMSNTGVSGQAIPVDVYIHETTTGEPDMLDPAVCYETRGGGVIQQVYETLYQYNGSKVELIPNLATGHTISPNGLTWTFTLRDDVTFHDGTPFNATAMKYSLDRAILMADPDGPSWMIADIKGAWDYHELAWSEDGATVEDAEDWLALDSIEADDANNKLTIHLDRNYIPFLAALTYAVGSAISPSFVYKHRDTQIPDGPAYTFDTGNNDSDQIDMGNWFSALAGTGSGIVPGAQNLYINKNTCGTGPYMLREWAPNVQIVLDRNDNWWVSNADSTKTPAIKEVYSKIVAEVATRLLDIKAVACDSAYIPATNMPEIYERDTATVLEPGLKVDLQDTFSVMYFGLNLNDSLGYVEAGVPWMEESGSSTYNAANFDKYSALNPDNSKASQDNPFTALKFRKAMAHAFDYDQFIINVLNGYGFRMVGVIPKGMFGHVDDLDVPLTDEALAKSLFQEVGWQGTMRLGYNSGNEVRKQGCILMKQNIEDLEIGISVVVEELEWSAYLDHLRGAHLPIYFIGWAPDYADPDNYAQPFLDSQGTLSKRQHFENAWIDSNITAAAIEQNPTQRADYYETIEEMAAADIAQLYLYQAQGILVSRDYVMGLDGYTSNPMASARAYWELWKQTAPVPGFEFEILFISAVGLLVVVELIRRRRN
ncbi:MAG: ABC transporter substrate-binding protein [Candidatus Hermodarchaeota archaeon]